MKEIIKKKMEELETALQQSLANYNALIGMKQAYIELLAMPEEISEIIEETKKDK